VGSKERRQRQREDLRTRILDAARELFVHRGYEATTMRAIAEEIEFTPTAIYHHFANKEALLHEICSTDFAQLAGNFQKIGRIPDPIERLDRLGRAYVDFALSQPMHYRLMFMTERPAFAPGSAAERDDPAASAYAFLRDTCVEAIGSGRVRPQFSDAEQLAQMLWASVHGIVSLHIAKCRDQWVDFRDVRQTAQLMCAVMLEGISLRQDGGT
jgi:AcrR family transcriptional regulator